MIRSFFDKLSQLDIGMPGIVILVLVTLLLRQPSSILNPQLYAEDGVWLRQAYGNNALLSLFKQEDGYAQVLTRIPGVIASYSPLKNAPLFFLLEVIIVRIYFISVLMSHRIKLFSNKKMKLLFAVMILFQPNTEEVQTNATYSAWYLSLAVLMLIFFLDPTEKYTIGDLSVIGLLGISSPFSILLFPLTLIYKILSKRKNLLFPLIILGITGITQLWLLYTSERNDFGTLAQFLNWNTLTQIWEVTSRQIIIGSIVGHQGYDWLLTLNGYLSLLVLITIEALSVITMFIGITYLKLEYKFGILYGSLIFILAMIKPAINDSHYFPILINSYGVRYWLIPSFLFLLTIFTVATWKNLKFYMRAQSICLCFIMLTFFVINKRDIQYEALPDLHWKSEVENFEKLPSQHIYKFPINPPSWSILLVKK